jgi:hypothetical protein
MKIVLFRGVVWLLLKVSSSRPGQRARPPIWGTRRTAESCSKLMRSTRRFLPFVVATLLWLVWHLLPNHKPQNNNDKTKENIIDKETKPDERGKGLTTDWLQGKEPRMSETPTLPIQSKCDLIQQYTLKHDETCATRADLVLPLLITGTGRAGTKYMSKTFQHILSLDLPHEIIGKQGSVSWTFAVKSPYGTGYPWNCPENKPRQPLGDGLCCVFGKSNGKIGSQHAHLPISVRFETILHQTRHPVNNIASLTTMSFLSWRYIRKVSNRLQLRELLVEQFPDLTMDNLQWKGWVVPDHNDPPQSTPKKLTRDEWLQDAMIHWATWNSFIARFSDGQFRIGDTAPWQVCRMIPTFKCPKDDEITTEFAKNVNTRPHSSVSYADLLRVNAPLTRVIQSLALQFGYDESLFHV